MDIENTKKCHYSFICVIKTRWIGMFTESWYAKFVHRFQGKWTKKLTSGIVDEKNQTFLMSF